ncbi:ferredoxin [Streptomyces sp. NPDC048483]|uniref:ferredoxin n=1 Tax=Streptomyces sp. NPDC048483 TaxID=3154927 RepID=UPI003438F77B
MRVSADRTACGGAGMCALNAPDMFDQDDDGLVTVLQSAPEGDDEHAAREAGHLCPSGAIQISEGPG